jgi:hypothetical protein
MCISTVMIHGVNSHLLPLALTGRESPLKILVTTPTKSLESGLSSSETHSESEEATEKGHHNQNRGGGCESCVCTAGVSPLGKVGCLLYSQRVIWFCGGIPCF